MQKPAKASDVDTGRGINVVEHPLVTTPVPAVSIEAAEAYAKEQFLIGYNAATEVSQIYQRRIVLLSYIESVTHALLAGEGLPAKWQGVQLKSLLSKHGDQPTMDERLRDACYSLDAAVRDFEKEYPGFPPERYADPEHDSFLIQLANDYAGGIRRLVKSDEPSADELRATLIKYGSDRVQQTLADIRANAPKTGRKSGPTALIKHILTETRKIREIHHTHTPGQDVDRWMKDLCRLDDVRAWERRRDELIGVARQSRLDDETLNVQAYDLFLPLSTLERGAKLKEMRDNHPGY